MVNKIYTTLAALLITGVLFSGCGSGSSVAYGDTDTLYMPADAMGFRLLSSGESSVLVVSNPWQGAEGVEAKVFLSRSGERAPHGFDGTEVEVPLSRVVCMSSSYVAFIDALGGIDIVKGVSGARYITNDTILARYNRSEVRDVGHDTNLNYEMIAGLRPDMVFIYGVAGENSSVTRKFDELGIKYLYIGDYVEQSPLGKAEWLVAFGEMLGCREQAIEKFTSIRNSYIATQQVVVSADSVQMMLSSRDRVFRPSVMLNAPYRDSWFVPGDGSYMVRLIEDAGGSYVCRGDDSSGLSRPVSAESAFVYASGSDVWLNPGQVMTMRELKSLNPRFLQIPPVVDGRVFNCNARTTSGGGSDFWESGAVRPDIVLKDMVAMLRPDILERHELYYFRKIE